MMIPPTGNAMVDLEVLAGIDNRWERAMEDWCDTFRRCPECGAVMDRQADFYDIGDHTETVDYWECPFCGFCG